VSKAHYFSIPIAMAMAMAMAMAYFRAIDLWVIGSARGKFPAPGELLQIL